MDHNPIALLLPAAALVVISLHQALSLRRARKARDEATGRIASAEQRAVDAAAETELSDAVVAKVWLHLDPDLLPVYRRASEIFGKPDADRAIRQAIQNNDWKLPERRN